ncbi:hypothetical protein PRIC1_001196 [Phytophthora ramorum]
MSSPLLCLGISSMEVDAANSTTGVAGDATAEQVPVSDASSTAAATEVAADQEAGTDVQETTETPEPQVDEAQSEQPVESLEQSDVQQGAEDVTATDEAQSEQPVESLEQSDVQQGAEDVTATDEAQSEQPVESLEQSDIQQGAEDVTGTNEAQENEQQQEDVEMVLGAASDPVASSSDGTSPAQAETATAGNAQQQSDVTTVSEGNESVVDATAPSKELTESEHQEDPSVEAAPVKPSNGDEDSSETTSPADAGTTADEQEPAEVASVDGTEADESMPPAHDESEYDPSAPVVTVSSVPHGEDEYDPANPSPAGTPVASNNQRPAAEQEEYDPDFPSMTSSAAGEEPAAMEVDETSSSTVNGEQATMTPAKRKAEDESIGLIDAPANGDTDPKRPRFVEDRKGSSHDGDPKHGRLRRGSGDSTSSSNSKHKHHDEDHKGLSAAAWDRLMDFQTSGEFRVTQVSRAAFASVGAMPEFAQISIIARFVRTPMRDVRDKNGQLMRIYREYQKENPQIAALQPVDAFMSDYKSEPGLFRFGYAPPQPTTGVSNVRVPYQRDQPEEDTPVRNSPRQVKATAPRPEPEQHQQKNVDEFGRARHQDKPSAHESNGSAPAHVPVQRSAVDPRLAARSRQGSPSPSVQAMPRPATGGRAEDPRRREQPHPQSSSGATRDPRRRGSLTNQQPSPRGGQPGTSRVAGSSDIYERLPNAVKAILNSMHREGRLQEPLNDNVVTRLLHLPEPVAVQAVENFSNVDLSQVGNLQGFLVGIINRVNEKAIASEKQHRPQTPSPRGHPPSALPRDYSAPPQGGSVLGGPPQGGRLNGSNGAGAGGYRAQQAPIASGPAPALFERPYEAPQDPRDPRRRQPAPQGAPQFGGAVRGPPQVGAGHGPGIGMQSFTALPMSVQNHVHSLVANRTLSSLEELGGKCYEVLGQLSEPLANQVLTRFAGANLSNVRNRSGFLIGVVKRARQEYGFNG